MRDRRSISPAGKCKSSSQVRIRDTSLDGSANRQARQAAAWRVADRACNRRRVRPVIAQNKPAAASNAGSYRIAGTVVNVATGEPIQRAVVSALGQDQIHSIASVVSDAQGHFALEGLAAAKYPLSASKRGFRTALYDDHEGYNTAIVTGPDQDTTI